VNRGGAQDSGTGDAVPTLGSSNIQFAHILRGEHRKGPFATPPFPSGGDSRARLAGVPTSKLSTTHVTRPGPTTSRLLIYHPVWAGEAAARLTERQLSLEIRIATNPTQAAKHINDVDMLLTENSFPTELLHNGLRLRWIHVAAAGVDRFGSVAARLHGVTVTRSVGTLGPRMAEYVFGSVLTLSQDVPRALGQKRERRWESYLQWWLHSRTLLVVGVGEVGRKVGSVGRAFGMRVLGVVRRPRRMHGIEEVVPIEELHKVLCDAHIVIVTLPLTQQTRGLFGPDEFAAMREDSVFVNIARGSIVQESALVAALRRKRPRWAILDVFDREPLPRSSPLWRLPNAIITPHLSGRTLLDEVLEEFCENLHRLRNGRRLRHIVYLA